MKLFQLFIVSILFTACSSDAPKNKAKDQQSPTVSGVKKSQKPSTRDMKKDPVVVEHTSTEADLAVVETPAAFSPEKPEKTKSEQELIAQEDPMVTPPVPTLNENIVSLEETQTEDQLLVANIKDKYNDLYQLQQTWADYSPKVETLIQYVAGPGDRETILFVQSFINDTPITPSQITEIEETLSEEGVFTNKNDREYAAEQYEHLEKYFNVFDPFLQISIHHLELAEQMYAQTTEEDAYTSEEIVDTEEDTTEDIATIETTPPEEVPAEVNRDEIEIETPTDEPVAQITETVDEIEVETSADEPVVEVKETADEIEVETPADEPVAEVKETVDEIEIETPVDEPVAQTTETNDEAVADIDASTEEAKETEEEEDSLSGLANAFFSGKWREWVDDAIDLLTPDFSVGWLLEPTSLKVPNTNTIVPEEENLTTAEEVTDTNSKQMEANEASQLIDQLLQKTNQFVQTYEIRSSEELYSHLTEIANKPETERTADQTALLNESKQIIQNITNQTDDIADFVESSGYISETLSQNEIVIIIEMFSDFVEVGTAQVAQKELAQVEPIQEAQELGTVEPIQEAQELAQQVEPIQEAQELAQVEAIQEAQEELVLQLEPIQEAQELAQVEAIQEAQEELVLQLEPIQEAQGLAQTEAHAREGSVEMQQEPAQQELVKELF